MRHFNNGGERRTFGFGGVKRVLCGALAAALVMTGLVVYGGRGAVSAASKSDLEEFKNNSTVKKYQDNINNLKKKQSELEGQISSLKGNIEDLREKKAIYDEQIEVYDSMIEETENLIAELSAQIEALNDSISTNEEESAALYDQIKERIRLSYESGNATYLELIFGAGDLSEFLIGIDRAVRLLEYDTSLMKDYHGTKEMLEEARTIANDNKTALDAQRTDLSKMLEESEELSDQCQRELDDALSQKASSEKLLKQFDEEMEAAAKKLDAYIDELIKQRGVTQNVAEGEFMWPLPTKYTTITSSFGPRKDPFGSGVVKNHTGTDIYAPKGTKIYASNNGTVIKAERDSSYGNYVLIDHGGGIYTLYAHASKLLVKAGQYVAKGTPIAEVGMTGSATGYHLHFEVREGTKRVNAMNYVKKP